jgi:hypothetical protein
MLRTTAVVFGDEVSEVVDTPLPKVSILVRMNEKTIMFTADLTRLTVLAVLRQRWRLLTTTETRLMLSLTIRRE